MSAATFFNENFNIETYRNYYINNIQYRAKPGIDRVSTNQFSNNIDCELKLINRKVQSAQYKYIAYRELLVLKKRDQLPRRIACPAIRDRITLGLIKELLMDSFRSEIDTDFVKSKVVNVTTEVSSGKYDTYIKIDMQNFYDSLDHMILMKKVRQKVRKKEVIHLIEEAIKTPTINEFEKRDMVEENLMGVPQGLPISNILATIYLKDFDKKYKNKPNVKYYRYVDDILVLCNSGKALQIANEIINELKNKYKLEPHKLCSSGDGKSAIGRIVDGFSYLGYQYYGDVTSVKISSKHRIEKSIEKLFSDFINRKSEDQNIDQLVWTLNLKITGAIIERKKYGWLYYFSQINDEPLLHHLDSLVQKFIDRFRLRKKLQNYQVKKFVRTYYEITKKRNATNYVPNFDDYSLEQKKEVLKNVFKYNVRKFNDEEVDKFFKRNVFRVARDLEKDIQNMS